MGTEIPGGGEIGKPFRPTDVTLSPPEGFCIWDGQRGWTILNEIGHGG